MTEPNYKPTPSTAPTNSLRSLNAQRSTVTNSYKGTTGSPLDNPLFKLRMNERPKAIPLSDAIADHEINLSKDKRKVHFFKMLVASKKLHQTICLSNYAKHKSY
jgi:hypothetical protein